MPSTNGCGIPPSWDRRCRKTVDISQPVRVHSSDVSKKIICPPAFLQSANFVCMHAACLAAPKPSTLHLPPSTHSPAQAYSSAMREGGRHEKCYTVTTGGFLANATFMLPARWRRNLVCRVCKRTHVRIQYTPTPPPSPLPSYMSPQEHNSTSGNMCCLDSGCRWLPQLQHTTPPDTSGKRREMLRAQVKATTVTKSIMVASDSNCL